MITYKKAQGKFVITLREGASLGRWDDFQFDLESRVIYGYRIKGSGMFAKAGGVKASNLTQVGRDVAFIHREDDVEWTNGGRNVEEGRSWASQYRGTRVMSRDGTAVGTVDDFVFDPENDRVLAVFLDSNRVVEISERVATGPAAVIIASAEQIQTVPGEARTNDDWWRRVFTSFSREATEEADEASAGDSDAERAEGPGGEE